MNLYEGIYCRKSIRNFLMEQLNDDLLECIKNYYKQLVGLFSGISVKMEIIDNISGNNKIHGLFTVKAPYYLLFYSEIKPEYMDNSEHLLNAGYIMEHISLYLTTKGIGSCFLGSAKPDNKLQRDDNYQHIITLAFGKSKDTIYREANKAKRLPLESVSVYKNEVGNNIKTMIKAAVLAPSAMNLQPWRLAAYDNRIHIFYKKGTINTKITERMKKIDIGIMIANIMIVAEELWVDASVKCMENITTKYFKNNVYVTSIVINHHCG